ncbi:hypothetical protein V6957_003777 [Vibrio parahaemolyticus]|uniref:hypothetical protein n=1 Tax=Vibrio harveyi group TaxID=717610 RepID=UPI00130392FB|nr:MULTISPECIES: hypothetical protein [Vibrio harveyi group]MCS0419827.1 hypothetical protein [Vibrio diabolicus]
MKRVKKNYLIAVVKKSSGENNAVIPSENMHPQALVYRELGKSSKIKTPTAKRLTALVKKYF